MIQSWLLRKGKDKVYAIELRRKQQHQVVMKLQGDIGPLKYGDEVIVNLNTNEIILIEREVLNEAA